jgi:hypothetical protein
MSSDAPALIVDAPDYAYAGSHQHGPSVMCNCFFSSLQMMASTQSSGLLVCFSKQTA